MYENVSVAPGLYKMLVDANNVVTVHVSLSCRVSETQARDLLMPFSLSCSQRKRDRNLSSSFAVEDKEPLAMKQRS